MREIKKFGIANFKPFGEKIQKFDLKPITLIYGPNSIGKSSVIHSIAYSHNIFQTQQYDISDINLGDKISLGGFSQFVHKKDLANDIQLEHTLNTKIDHHIDHYRAYEYYEKQKHNLLDYIMIQKTLENVFADVLLDDDEEWSFNASHYLDEQNTILTFLDHNILQVINALDIVDTNSENWSKKPIKKLQNFLDHASSQTLGLFSLVNDLYKKYDDINDTFYIDFNYRDLALAFMNNEDKRVAFCKDIESYIDIYFKDKWSVVYDPIIEVKTTVGKYDKQIVDKSTNYYIGSKVLVETLRIEPEEKKAFDSEWSKKIYELNKSFTGATDNRNRYFFRIHTDHWMIQRLIEALDKKTIFGKDSIAKPSIREKLPKHIDVNFTGIDSVLLYTNENMHDTKPLMNLKVNLEKGFEDYKNSLEEDYDEFQESPTLYDEFDDVYENAKIFELLDTLSVDSYEHVIFRLIVSWMASVNTILQQEKANFKYIGPLRTLPERYEFSFSENNQTQSKSNSIWHLIKNNPIIKSKVNEWLSSEKLKTPYELKIQEHIKIDEQTTQKLKEIFSSNSDNYTSDIINRLSTIKEMSFYDKRYNTPVNIREMGLGISQMLPILVSLLNDKNHVIAVEQPELHLHPAVQSDLADEFIKSYKNNSNTSLIETHSEHLLLRLMKRMRQTQEGILEDEKLALTPDDVSILYVDADDKKTYILELQLDEDGSLLDPWPGGFFEEGFTERFF